MDVHTHSLLPGWFIISCTYCQHVLIEQEATEVPSAPNDSPFILMLLEREGGIKAKCFQPPLSRTEFPLKGSVAQAALVDYNVTRNTLWKGLWSTSPYSPDVFLQ